jgi:hypothetical protein
MRRGAACSSTPAIGSGASSAADCILRQRASRQISMRQRCKAADNGPSDNTVCRIDYQITPVNQSHHHLHSVTLAIPLLTTPTRHTAVHSLSTSSHHATFTRIGSAPPAPRVRCMSRRVGRSRSRLLCDPRCEEGRDGSTVEKSLPQTEYEVSSGSVRAARREMTLSWRAMRGDLDAVPSWLTLSLSRSLRR